MNKSDFPIRDQLVDPIEHEMLERVRRKVARSRHRSMRQSRLSIGVAVAAAALLAAVWWQTRDVGPVKLASGERLDTLRSTATLGAFALDDGSELRLTDHTRLEAIRNDDREVLLVMSEGHGEFRIQPGGPRRWRIDAGLATIDVVGTRFHVYRQSRSLRVTVQAGVVRVHGPRVDGGVQRLEAGDEYGLDVDSPELAEPEPGEVEPSTDEATTPSSTAREGEVAEHSSERASVSSDSWRRLAQQGEHRRAYQLLGAGGIARQSTEASVDELFELADVARLSGHPAQAVPPLRRLVNEYSVQSSARSGTHSRAAVSRAAVAAFSLGRIYADVLAQPADAAQAFERAVTIGCPRSLDEQARARWVQALLASGQHRNAQRRAAEYLEHYPNGTHAPRFIALSERQPPAVVQ